MNRPVIYTDFDGVLNAFPDSKIQRRGGVGHTGWLKPDDPRASLYSSDHAFPLTGNLVVEVPPGRYRLRWSRELADGFHKLAVAGMVELAWLTTWQPYCVNTLDPALGWNPDIVYTVRWYDPVTNQGRFSGKLDTIFSRLRFETYQEDPSPIIWLDDEECYPARAKYIETWKPAAPLLMIRPDERIGISRRQWLIIQDFVHHPDEYPPVTLDEEPTIRAHAMHHGL
jgi:hypothetical protein